jgi:DNA-binding Lrp family transcriptional regulator
MKTNVADNSLIAYWAMRDSGELPEKERVVYEALASHGRMTREQIAYVTGMKEGSACGRVKGLMEKGLVVGVATMVNPNTHKLNEAVDIAPMRKAMRQIEFELQCA